MNPVEVTGVGVTAKEFDDAKRYCPLAELYFFSQRNMRRETDPIEPGYVSIESPIFAFPCHSAGRRQSFHWQ